MTATSEKVAEAEMPEAPSSEPEDVEGTDVKDDDAEGTDGIDEGVKDAEVADEDDEDIPFGRQANKDKADKTRLRDRPWGRYLRRSALPLLLVASLAVSGLLGWKLWQEHQVKEAGQQAQQAAIAYAQVLTSIDSNKVDENFRQVLDGATGEFKDMYTQSSVQLRQLLIDNKASAHGVVVDSAIQSASTNKVVVLVFIDQTVANSQSPDPRIDRSRIKMTMEKVDGRWRASKVQLL
ncbi:tetratricopeptide repeat protein [Mycobacterium ahvazicum]|uniref:tetratricopeptide repeat protein n=1 Tax=Mycobacterium ahvazicum TaxID=1964395 RepID=UPI002696181B